MNLRESLKAARRTSTPVVAVSTQDQRAFVAAAIEAMNGKDELVAHFTWDALRGVRAANEEAAKHVARLGEAKNLGAQTGNPAAMLDFAATLPPKSVVFAVNFHRFVGDAVVATGVGNLRDLYKQDQRMIVLLGPSFTLPAELQQDVVLLDDPLPNDEALAAVVRDVYEGAGLKAPADVADTVSAVRGLAAFPAEQVVAMALRKDGIDVESAWERKRATVNQTRGLKMTLPGKAAPIKGLGAILKLTDALAEHSGFGAVLRVDEIEKQMAGAQGDTSGVSQDILGTILRTMEDEGWTGLVAVGPAGTGKSLVSKTVGSRAGKPTMELDLGAVKGSLVGQSEAQIREALKVAGGVADGKILVIATCNKLDVLPPELRRRFKLGTWFFDLPTEEERADIWKLYLGIYKTKDSAVPEDESWTGAEVRNCCELAAQTGMKLADAARCIVPVAVADPQAVERLRALADGRFLSASRPGVYRRDEAQAQGKRKVVWGQQG